MDIAQQIQQDVIDILETDEVYLVGGSVRDLVMGGSPKDYDFCTSMLPEDIEKKVKAAGRRVYGVGKKFGTIGFKVPIVIASLPSEDGKHKFLYEYEYVEVTTFRSEAYTSKSRKPEVKFVPSLDEDLARRDFTMNAMVLRPDGTIYDPYGGKLDIHAKLIKTVGMPKNRIQEDPLRMLRAARFAARYGFQIDSNFIGKAKQLADRIFDVSVERWVVELDKLITSKDAYIGLNALHQMELAQRILPELYAFETPVNPFDCCGEIKSYENVDEAWNFLLSNIYISEAVKEPTRTMKYIQTGICQRLKFSSARTNAIIKGDIYKEK